MLRDPSPIVDSNATVSDKIRALAQAGYPRAEIARLLGKRYQHVRNVLVDDESRDARQAPPGSAKALPLHRQLAEAGAPYQAARPIGESNGVFWLDVTPDGGLRLPEPIRSALDVVHGGKVVARLAKDGTVTLVSAEAAFAQVQALFQRYAKPGISLADELIADRRAEALRESQDD